MLQSQKCDESAKFIIDNIPELKNVQPKHIHDWENFHNLYKNKVSYASPIVSHEKRKSIIINSYKKALYDDYVEEEKTKTIDKYNKIKKKIN